MAKTSQVSSLSQNCKSDNWSDAGYSLKTVKIGIVLEIVRGTLFDFLEKSAQILMFLQDYTKHPNCFRIFRNRKTDAIGCSLVKVFQPCVLVLFPSDLTPGKFNELGFGMFGHSSRIWKEQEEFRKPFCS